MTVEIFAEAMAKRKAVPTDPGTTLAEDDLALEFTRRHGHELRYVAPWGTWMRWTGTIWRKETTLEAYDLARTVCRDAGKGIDNQRSRAKILSASTRAAVENMARSDRAHAATIDQWDADPLAFATLDLRTGTRREPSPGDYITKETAVEPAPLGTLPPMWTEFLDTITGKSTELQDYLQRMAGYCLTGLTIEHVLFFLYGTGANGKSVFINTLVEILRDYAARVGTEMLMVSNADRHPTEVACLRGIRLAVANETEIGKTWASAKIKSFTGGDRLKGRFMRQDFFEFQPQFKLVIVGNHKPSLRGVDEAIRRRLHLVPFTITIPAEERDPHLFESLKAEWPGILAWAIEGALKWRAQGLNPPECVRSATAKYLKPKTPSKPGVATAQIRIQTPGKAAVPYGQAGRIGPQPQGNPSPRRQNSARPSRIAVSSQRGRAAPAPGATAATHSSVQTTPRTPDMATEKMADFLDCDAYDATSYFTRTPARSHAYGSICGTPSHASHRPQPHPPRQRHLEPAGSSIRGVTSQARPRLHRRG